MAVDLDLDPQIGLSDMTFWVRSSDIESSGDLVHELRHRFVHSFNKKIAMNGLSICDC